MDKVKLVEVLINWRRSQDIRTCNVERLEELIFKLSEEVDNAKQD